MSTLEEAEKLIEEWHGLPFPPRAWEVIRILKEALAAETAKRKAAEKESDELRKRERLWTPERTSKERDEARAELERLRATAKEMLIYVMARDELSNDTVKRHSGWRSVIYGEKT